MTVLPLPELKARPSPKHIRTEAGLVGNASWKGAITGAGEDKLLASSATKEGGVGLVRWSNGEVDGR